MDKTYLIGCISLKNLNTNIDYLPSWSVHVLKLKPVGGCQRVFTISALMVLFSPILACCYQYHSSLSFQVGLFAAEWNGGASVTRIWWPRGKGSLVWPKAPQGDSDSIPISTATARKVAQASETSHSQPAAHTQGQCYPSDERTKTDAQFKETPAEAHMPGTWWHYRWRNFLQLPGFSEYLSFSCNNVYGLGEKIWCNQIPQNQVCCFWTRVFQSCPCLSRKYFYKNNI